MKGEERGRVKESEGERRKKTPANKRASEKPEWERKHAEPIKQ